MISIQQAICTKDYKKALYQHYFGYKYTYISPVLGAFLFLILLVILVSDPVDFDYKMILALLFSAYVMLRPVMYVRQVLNALNISKTTIQEFTLQITDEGELTTTDATSKYVLNIKDLYAYSCCDKRRFLFLYKDKAQYLILDKQQMNKNDVEEIIRLLDVAGIAKK